MNKRFLNKKTFLLLKQPLPENISQKARLRGKERRAKFIADSGQKKTEHARQFSFAHTQKLSKLDKMRQAEMQIVRELLQRRGLKDTILGVSNRYSEDATSKVCYLQNKKHQREKFQPALKKFVECGVHHKVLLLLSIEQIRNILVEKRIERQIPSELRSQLLESKKIRFLYGGLSKRELKKSIEKARRLLGSTTDNLLLLLESRLDASLKRCGFFPSVRAARQSVVHKQIQINNKTVSTPGYQLQPGDLIKVQPVSACLANRIENDKKKEYDQQDCLKSSYNCAKAIQKARQFNSVLRKDNLTKAAKKNGRINKEMSQLGRFSFLSPHITSGANKKKYSTLDSLLQLECFFSNICVPKGEKKKYNTTRRIPEMKKELKQGCGSIATLQARVLRFCTRFAVLHKQWGIKSLLHDLHTNKKTFLRLDKLVENSQLFFALQNKSESKNQHFVRLFVSTFGLNFEKSDCTEKDPALKALSGIFQGISPHLNIHLQQLFLEAQQAAFDRAPRAVQEQRAVPSIDHTFYNVYAYWLQLTKRLFLQDAKKQLSKLQNVPSVKEKTVRSQKRKTKPLHLEVSFQSFSAIFLYPPQQIYLPALVNIDLLLKSL